MSTETYTGPVADPGGDPLDQAGHADVLDLGGGHDLEAEFGVLGQVGVGVQRAADPGVHAAGPVQQALLGRPAERRAVRVRGAEVRVPGVQVRVEVDHGHRAVHRGHRAEHGQRNGVVAAQRQHERGAFQQGPRAPLDGADRLVDAERVDGQVPASATCWSANTGTCRAGLYGRSSREDSLMWDGPNRARAGS
jgi:hypothetical protein